MWDRRYKFQYSDFPLAIKKETIYPCQKKLAFLACSTRMSLALLNLVIFPDMAPRIAVWIFSAGFRFHISSLMHYLLCKKITLDHPVYAMYSTCRCDLIVLKILELLIQSCKYTYKVARWLCFQAFILNTIH